MAENYSQETENVPVSRDQSMDYISALMSNSSAEAAASAKSIAEGKPPVQHLEPKKEKTPLEKAIEAKENKPKGLIVSQDIDKAPEPLRPITDSDEAREAMQDALDAQLTTIDKVKMVYVKKPLVTQVDHVKLMDELDGVWRDDEGIIHVPEGAEYIAPKNPDVIEKVEKIRAAEAAGEQVNESAPERRYVDGDTKEMENVVEKGNIVKILIDKTGMGANISFDEEEKKAIQTSQMIHVVEVEKKEISVARVRAKGTNDSFLNSANAHQVSVSKAPITFPASGFKADMTGLSIGEFYDIMMDLSKTDEDEDDFGDYLDFDKIHKRLSVIYNRMTNISVGEFASFEDFLHHFAYSDVNLAIYALAIASLSERETLSLPCQRCGKRFNYTYSPRSLIDFNTASMETLEKIERLNSPDVNTRKDLYDGSPINVWTRIELPSSLELVDFGDITAYDYLYRFIPTIVSFQNRGFTVEDPIMQRAMMLTAVRRIYVPLGDGTYEEISDMTELANHICYEMNVSDGAIIEAGFDHYRHPQDIGFSFKDVDCPHCGIKRPRVEISPDELVFLSLHQQRGTQITFGNLV